MKAANGGEKITLKRTTGSGISQDGDDALRFCTALKITGTYQKPKQKKILM